MALRTGQTSYEVRDEFVTKATAPSDPQCLRVLVRCAGWPNPATFVRLLPRITVRNVPPVPLQEHRRMRMSCKELANLCRTTLDPATSYNLFCRTINDPRAVVESLYSGTGMSSNTALLAQPANSALPRRRCYRQAAGGSIAHVNKGHGKV